jgi:hypothetical protein
VTLVVEYFPSKREAEESCKSFLLNDVCTFSLYYSK